MNRRDFLMASAGTMASFIIPAPRKRIDLKAFCSRHHRPTYDMRLPYEFQEHTYATNGIVCVQVRPQLGDVVQHQGRIPPFDRLSWDHSRIQGWKPLPRLSPIPATDSHCPACEGYGHTGEGVASECRKCDGFGEIQEYDRKLKLSYGRQCPKCDGRGWRYPAGTMPCPHCHGEAFGTFPAIVEINGEYWNAAIYEKVRALDGEYVIDRYHDKGKTALLKFRFDGGCGHFIGMETAGVKKRIEAARS